MAKKNCLPCPFCSQKLKKIKNGYEHKSSQCILSSFNFTDVELPKWNERKPVEQIMKEMEEKSFSLYSDKTKGTKFVWLKDALEIVKQFLS